MKIFFAAMLCLAAVAAPAQTNVLGTNLAAVTTNGESALAEQIRTECVNNRRFICGKVMQIFPDGIVVDSGYTSLLQPPYHDSWVVPGIAVETREANAVEAKTPDAVCLGLVFLTDLPKRPKVKRYDYVVIHGYPAGEYDYVPLGNIHKTIRKFAGGVERAVTLNLQARGQKKP